MLIRISVLIAALIIAACITAPTVKPLAGICDQPDPALAMMGTPPESLHMLARSTCLVVGVKVIPNP